MLLQSALPAVPCSASASVIGSVKLASPSGGCSPLTPTPRGSPAGSIHIAISPPKPQTGSFKVFPVATTSSPVRAPAVDLSSPSVALRDASPMRAAMQPAPAGEVACLTIGKECNAVALSPDGRSAAVGCQDHTLQIWDVLAKTQRHILRGHKNWVNAVAYSHDGTRVASASSDKTVKLWSSSTGSCTSTLQGHLNSVSAVVFSPDSLRVASGSWDKTLCIWDIAQGRALMTLQGHTDWVHGISWAPGGHHLASASSDHCVRVWSTISSKLEHVLIGHQQTVTCVSFARNNAFAASGSLDCTVRIWKVHEGSLAALMHPESDDGSIHCISFVANSDKVAIGFGSKRVKVWNFRTRSFEAQFTGHSDVVQGISVSPDGAVALSCSHDQTLRVWKLMPNTKQYMEAAGDLLGCTYTSASSSNLLGRSKMPASARSLMGHSKMSPSKFFTELQKERDATIYGRSHEVREHNSAMYGNVIAGLAAEKERLEKSMKAMQTELQQLPLSSVIKSTQPPSLVRSASPGRDPRLLQMTSPRMVQVRPTSPRTDLPGVFQMASSGTVRPASPGRDPRLLQMTSSRAVQLTPQALPASVRKEPSVTLIMEQVRPASPRKDLPGVLQMPSSVMVPSTPADANRVLQVTPAAVVKVPATTQITDQVQPAVASGDAAGVGTVPAASASPASVQPVELLDVAGKIAGNTPMASTSPETLQPGPTELLAEARRISVASPSVCSSRA